MRETTARKHGAWTTQAADLLLLAIVAWLTDVILAWLGGLRWGHWRFFLPSVGMFLALGFLAIALGSTLPAARKRLFSIGVVVLTMPASFLLWIQRLAWRPGDHHIGTTAWIVISLSLLAAPFLLARLRPAWLIAATPLLVLAYHNARTRGFQGQLSADAVKSIGAAVAMAVAVFFLSRLRVQRQLQHIGIAACAALAVLGTATLMAWSNKTFVDETIRPGRPVVHGGRENIVLVVVDTLRADRLGAYGYRVRDTSPFLDRFGAGSMFFRNAYASTTWTVPSVATMFTGLPPELHGVTVYGKALQPGKSLLTETLVRRGFHTIGISTNPLIDQKGGFARGFDRFVSLSRMLTATGSGGSLWFDVIITLQRGSREGWLPAWFAGWTVKPRAEHAIDEALSRLKAAPEGQSVFLFVHLLDPHHPPSVTANEATRRWMVTDADRRFDPAWSLGYDREVRYVDSQLERFIHEVDRVLDPSHTTVVIVADHGEQLGEDSKRGHGLNLDEAVLRVPLMIRRPGEPARVIEEAFSLNHLREMITDPGRSVPRAPYVRAHLVPPPRPEEFLRSVQTENWKLVEITRGSMRQELLFQLPDETISRTSQVPSIADALRRKLAELPAAATPAPYDAETASKLRSLGYLQ